MASNFLRNKKAAGVGSFLISDVFSYSDCCSNSFGLADQEVGEANQQDQGKSKVKQHFELSVSCWARVYTRVVVMSSEKAFSLTFWVKPIRIARMKHNLLAIRFYLPFYFYGAPSHAAVAGA